MAKFLGVLVAALVAWTLAATAAVARNGAAGKNRTFDPALTKGVLYP